MPPLSSRRKRTAMLAAGAVVLAGAAVGTWAWAGRDGGGDGCAALGKDGRIRTALGTSYKSGMSCAELGHGMKTAALGDKAGVHTVRQAQAMREILAATFDTVDRHGYQSIGPSLALPLAQLLADYAPDTHEILMDLDADYATHLNDKQPWRDAFGVHMTVPHDDLVQVMRAVSASPSAYATIRRAESGHAAVQLAEVPAGATGFDLSTPPVGDALALGAFDGIAAHVVSHLSKRDGTSWESQVKSALAEMTRGKAPVPVYKTDPVGYLTQSWSRSLRNDAKPVLTALRGQSAAYLRLWAEGRGAALPGDVVSKCQESGDREYQDTLELLKNGGRS
ncbi:hypothetical protein [Streptomyces sp. NK08204]|uniref:hypothetical protein n=1 Tax=Streptomyces sp. NK08204 TaxID=2873260 RepID=UPI001CECDE1B|nr:hypothetical protein [Streptomyces sp. NK08204]